MTIIAAPPPAQFRAAIARALVRRNARRLPIRVVLPDGQIFGGVDGDPALRLTRPGAFFRRVGASGLIGFGESYQDGDWTSDDLPRLLEVLASHVTTIVPGWLQWIRRFYAKRLPSSESGTLANSRHNIERHYNLSNDLFATFLDSTMTYSAALFGDLSPTWDNLATAQRRKIDRLLDLLQVRPGTRLLEIGTGWGELAARAANRGAFVDTVTLSSEQRSYALSRLSAAGLSSHVDVRLCDYREIPGTARYDAIVSVEMIEAVGERYWPGYFATIRRLLAPGGRVGIQAITMAHKRMLATRNTYTWIQKYIFPGGLIPSAQVIQTQSGLALLDRYAFGNDYAHTLRLWRQRFLAQSSHVDSLGFDEVFRRTWDLYLAYSQAGFASGYLDVEQFIFGGRS